MSQGLSPGHVFAREAGPGSNPNAGAALQARGATPEPGSEPGSRGSHRDERATQSGRRRRRNEVAVLALHRPPVNTHLMRQIAVSDHRIAPERVTSAGDVPG